MPSTAAAQPDHPRHDFSAKTREMLAKRAGWLCSAPSCRALTIGPSETAVSKVSDVGKAAHITAAAPGGARYDATLSEQERKAYENGVWLCATHADQVDRDEERFPRELLVAWRNAAEAAARDAQGRGLTDAQEISRALVSVTREIDAAAAAIPKLVQRFLWDVGAERAWGRQYELARVALSEIALNAALHGGAPSITLQAHDGTVILTDHGRAFGMRELLAKPGSGGHHAVGALLRHGEGRLTLTYRRAGDRNEWALADELHRRGAGRPCAATVPDDRHAVKAGDWVEAERLQGCEEIHVYVPDLLVLSDVMLVVRAIRRHVRDAPICLHNFRFGSFVPEVLADMGVRCVG